MSANDTHRRIISISGKNGIRVETEVHEYENFYRTKLYINGMAVYSRVYEKPEPEPQLTFRDLKQGAEFTLVNRGDKSVFMKIQSHGGKSAVWIENKDPSDIDYGRKGTTCFIPDDAEVEEIIDL